MNSCQSPTFTPGFAAGTYNAARALSEIRRVLPPPVLLIPLCAREKKPALKGWADLAGPEDPLVQDSGIFGDESGIGLVCGEPSGGLCFLDVDDDGSIDRLERMVPELATAHRIFGARGCKWLVRVRGRARGFALRGAAGKRIGEFLGLRQQGVVAGIHPLTGLPYRWQPGATIPEIDMVFIKTHFSNYAARETHRP